METARRYYYLLADAPFTDRLNVQEIVYERSRLLASLPGPDEPRLPAPKKLSTRKRIFLVLVLVVAILLIVALLVTGVTLGVEQGLRGTTAECTSATYLFDCYPEGGANVTSCRSRGCCWNSLASPSCFYPDGFGYVMDGALSEETYGRSATLSRKANQPAQYREPVATLRVDVYLETEYRLRVKVGPYLAALYACVYRVRIIYPIAYPHSYYNTCIKDSSRENVPSLPCGIFAAKRDLTRYCKIFKEGASKLTRADKIY